MDKTPLHFLFVAAVFGGILCDKYVGTSLPYFTFIFIGISTLIYFSVTKTKNDEEE